MRFALTTTATLHLFRTGNFDITYKLDVLGWEPDGWYTMYVSEDYCEIGLIGELL